MGLSMENFNIMRSSLKNLLFMGGKKNREELPKNGGLGQFPYLKLGLAKNKGGVDTLMHTYAI